MVPVIFVFLGTLTSNAGPMSSEEESVSQILTSNAGPMSSEEGSEVELVGVKTGFEVLLDHVPQRVDVGAGVHHHAELRQVADGPVGHGHGLEHHGAQPVLSSPARLDHS